MEGRYLCKYVDDGKLYASSSFAMNVRHLQCLLPSRAPGQRAKVCCGDKQDFAHFTNTMRKLAGQPLPTLARTALTLPNNADGHNTLRPASLYRWLSIYWDPKRNFGAHVEGMAARADGVVYAMSMLGNTGQRHGVTALFAICAYRMHAFYLMFRRYSLLHRQGAEDVHTLDVALRCGLRQILGAFKTTHTDALHIETSIATIDPNLQDRREGAARRFICMPGHHAIFQRLGGEWSCGAAAENPPPLTPPSSINTVKLSRLQRLGWLFPAHGDSFLIWEHMELVVH